MTFAAVPCGQTRRPHLVPVPKLDEHVIRGGQNIREDRVDGKAADVVRVGFKGLHTVHSIVVVDADEHVIRAADDPLLASHKLGRADCRGRAGGRSTSAFSATVQGLATAETQHQTWVPRQYSGWQ